MIQYVSGNILDSKAQALVNTVNTMGVMGKGIALQFKKAYPNNYKAYEKACKWGEVEVGKMFITEDFNTTSGDRIIINFPTKTSWKKPSEYKYIEDGLDSLIAEINARKIESIAIPPLGAGNGGLNWERVKKLIEEKLKNLRIDIYLYEPSLQIQEHLKTETLVSDAYEDVKQHVESNTELLTIANRTIIFLSGFYSDFALELLSSIDYIATKENTFDKHVISHGLEKWSSRKRSLFSNPKYFEISLKHLQCTNPA